MARKAPQSKRKSGPASGAGHSGRTNIRINPQVLARWKMEAKAERRDLSDWIRLSCDLVLELRRRAAESAEVAHLLAVASRDER